MAFAIFTLFAAGAVYYREGVAGTPGLEENESLAAVNTAEMAAVSKCKRMIHQAPIRVGTSETHRGEIVDIKSWVTESVCENTQSDIHPGLYCTWIRGQCEEPPS